jgi:cytochrome c-type biogenesis protein CcmH
VNRLCLFFFTIFSIFSLGSRAAEDPALEKRVMTLSSELRCLVCQNQTLADSNAELAVDLRDSIREQMKRGASDQEVIGFLTARYGDFVLYRPPLKATTLLLWCGPFLLVGIGAFFLVRFIRRRRIAAPQFTEAERERAARLLQE